MPQTLSYPGVYIEEISSGVHTITGVATSIAAFIGWANQGPVDRAVLVQSWSDFQSQFGGLTSNNGVPNYLGYAVNQFFANGGQQAYIIRIAWLSTFQGGTTSVTACATASGTIGGTLDLYAANPGNWGNYIQVNISASPIDLSRFTLTVLYAPPTPAGQIPQQPQVVESFPNLSITASDPRYVVTIINSDSQYLTFVDPAAPNATIPAPGNVPTSTVDSPPGTLSGEPLGNITQGLDGTVLTPNDGNFETALGADPGQTSTNSFGLRLLDRVDIFNLLCVPGETQSTTIQSLQQYCHMQRALYIVDCPQDIPHGISGLIQSGPVGGDSGNITGQYSINSALYFPWVESPDPLYGNRPTFFPPCGFVAGIYASTDAQRGVWKAPAGIDASLTNVSSLQYNLTDLENGQLNTQAVNCLREFKIYGDIVWGARTLQGNDQVGSQWKYVPIRRLALFLESSLYDGTQWVIFEPNDENLWGQIRLNVGVFMQGLFLQGAFQGTTPQQAYFVKCDGENNPQSSIDQGIVNILVGFAPLYPAEFVVIQIQQMAGQLQS